MPHLRTAKLMRWHFWLVIGAGSALWISGAVWLLLHYFGQRAGEYGPELNPAEPWMMILHGLVLIPALLGCGGLMIAHIPKGWNFTAQRVAGLAMTLVLAVLILSGYLLYYAGDEILRNWTSIIHWSIGLALPLVFGWHYINGRKLRQTKPQRARRKAPTPSKP
jgi:hypothetical protein